MSIIEQLGGYADAKDISRRSPFDLSQEELKALQKAGVLNTFGLEKVLLEYRRANNIFEEFDMLVYMEMSDISKIYRMVSAKPNSEGYIWMMGKGGLVYENIKYLIHATDQEIAARHRLPQLEVLNDIDIPPSTIILGDK